MIRAGEYMFRGNSGPFSFFMHLEINHYRYEIGGGGAGFPKFLLRKIRYTYRQNNDKILPSWWIYMYKLYMYNISVKTIFENVCWLAWNFSNLAILIILGRYFFKYEYKISLKFIKGRALRNLWWVNLCIIHKKALLKGLKHEIFELWFFAWIDNTWALEQYPKIFSKIFLFSRRYLRN